MIGPAPHAAHLDDTGTCELCELPAGHPSHTTAGRPPTGRPVARTTDPSTSHAAAASIDQLRPRQAAVLDVLRVLGPMTDEELAAEYGQAIPAPPQSVSGLRTRRAELVDRGLVVDTGDRRILSSGRAGIVWAAR